MGFLSKALITAAVGAGAALLFKVSAEEKEKKAEEVKPAEASEKKEDK